VKKALLFLAIFFVPLFLNPSLVKAQSALDSLNEYGEAQNANEQTGIPSREAWSGGIVEDIQHSIVCAGVNDSNVCQIEDSTSDSGYKQSAVATIGSLIGSMYEYPPAQTQVFIADILDSAQIVPKAQAQGLGFAALNPVLETWKAFRNVAYLFFVVIFLVIGFMILTRSKLGGQAVVTAQQAIPQIIIALIAVTFSYAIAGLLIDAMYLIMFLFLGLFPGTLSIDPLNIGIFELGKEMIREGRGNTFAALNTLVTNALSSGTVADVLGAFSGATVGVIVVIAIIFSVVKLFFILLKTYITIILYVAFAPIILMMGALPGSQTFAGWIKNLVGNLSAFPVILLMLILHQSLASGDLSAGGFMPPFILGGQGVGSIIVTIMGIGIILILPEIVTKTQEALGAKDGVFTQFAKDMGKSFSQGEVFLPVAGKGIGYLGGGAVGAAAEWQQGGRTRQKLWQGFQKGRDIGGRTWGGAQEWGRKGQAAGQWGRVRLDRALEGRLFDAEDLTTLIGKRFGGGKGGGGKGGGGTPPTK